MKFFLSFIVMAISLQVSSQSMAEGILGRKTLAGKVSGAEVRVVLDKEVFIKAANDAMFKGEPVFDGLTIEKGETLGGKKLNYYYLLLFSSKKNLKVVRWLHDRSGSLFIDASEGPEENIFEEYYFGCEGEDFCFPRLFYINSGYQWSCREILGCVSAEEAEANKCRSIITLY